MVCFDFTGNAVFKNVALDKNVRTNGTLKTLDHRPLGYATDSVDRYGTYIHPMNRLTYVAVDLNAYIFIRAIRVFLYAGRIGQLGNKQLLLLEYLRYISQMRSHIGQTVIWLVPDHNVQNVHNDAEKIHMFDNVC